MLVYQFNPLARVNKMEKEIKDLVIEVCKKWDYYKSKEIKRTEFGVTCVTTLTGKETAWDNPNILWLISEIENGCYDGSGCQVGLTKEGQFVWEFQSHCSCNDFQDSSGKYGDGLLAIDKDLTKKSYELSRIPDDWAKLVLVDLENILKL